jgi:exonuclease VII large subunit
MSQVRTPTWYKNKNKCFFVLSTKKQKMRTKQLKITIFKNMSRQLKPSGYKLTKAQQTLVEKYTLMSNMHAMVNKAVCSLTKEIAASNAKKYKMNRNTPPQRYSPSPEPSYEGYTIKELQNQLDTALKEQESFHKKAFQQQVTAVMRAKYVNTLLDLEKQIERLNKMIKEVR